MFTQKLGLNTNRCNACQKLCVLSAYYITNTNGKYRYLPVIDNEVRTRSTDTKGNVHPLRRPYATVHDAINAAKQLSRQCKDFKDIRTPRPPKSDLNYDRCVGCKHRCMVSSQKIQGVFIPKIGTQLIKAYINRFGETERPNTFYTDFKAKMDALRIAKMCDNYLIKR